MTYRGKVERGVVVLEGGVLLPEGTEVTVLPSDRVAQEPATSETPTVWKKLTELGRWAESQSCNLPADLAANHDHYLHGLANRK